MLKIQFLFLLLLLTIVVCGQNVGINNINPNVSLDIKGGLATRAFTVTPVANAVNIPDNESFVLVAPGTAAVTCYAPAFINGQRLILFNTGGFNLNFLTYVIPPNEVREFICRSPGGWTLLSGALSTEGWSLKGNAGTDTSVNFIGTTDNKPLKFKANNQPAGILDAYYLNTAFGPNAYSKFNGNFSAAANVAIGAGALANDTIGNGNTAVGYESMDETRSAGLQNTAVGGSSLRFNTGSRNSAFGGSALGFIRTGNYNTALGAASMGYRLNGDLNTAVGQSSLGINNGNENVVVGANAMLEDQIGDRNTAVGSSAMERSRQSKGSIAVGYRALYSDTAAEGIVAIGRAALYSGIRRQGNIAIGDSAMFSNGINAASNADGSANVAIGSHVLFTNQTGYSNTSIGYYSMYSNQTGTANTVIGGRALALNVSGGSNTVVGETALYNNTNGFQNTALGTQSLHNNIAGNQNVAVGGNSLYKNKNGNGGVAIGYTALYRDSAANGTVAIGRAALYNNNGQEGNLAIGDSALFNNGRVFFSGASYATNNTAIGQKSLITNIFGDNNTAVGFQALYKNSISDGNTAVGSSSLASNDNGRYNTATGHYAMYKNISGGYNTALGMQSLYNNNSDENTALGYASGFQNLTGSGNVFLGNFAGYSEMGSNKLYIENTFAGKDFALIYGDFEADSLLLNGKTVIKNNEVVRGYTKLGGYDADVPSIKMKKISIPAGPAINAVQSYPLGSGITDAKVVGIQVLMNYAGSWKIPPAYIDAAGYEYNVQVQNNNIVIVLKSGNSANIGGKPISVIVTYEE